MTKSELYAAIVPAWLSDGGLVKSTAGDNNPDNGVMFTCVLQVLTGRSYLKEAVDHCFMKPGLLQRRPAGSSQEAFDDYLAFAVASIYTNNRTQPRQILWHGFKHLGFYNNTSTFTWNAFLGRDVEVWALMFAAAFPSLKYLVWPLLYTWVTFLNPSDISNCSGLQLQWLIVEGYDRLYDDMSSIRWLLKLISNTKCMTVNVFEGYYGPDHPFTKYVRNPE